MQYMAPEILEGTETVEAYQGAEADVYSAGIIIMTMVFGVHPFNNGSATIENPIYNAYIN